MSMQARHKGVIIALTIFATLFVAHQVGIYFFIKIGSYGEWAKCRSSSMSRLYDAPEAPGSLVIEKCGEELSYGVEYYKGEWSKRDACVKELSTQFKQKKMQDLALCGPQPSTKLFDAVENLYKYVFFFLLPFALVCYLIGFTIDKKRKNI